MEGTKTSTVKGPEEIHFAENHFQHLHHVCIYALDQLQMYGRHIRC